MTLDFGGDLTLSGLDAWLENPPEGAERRINGRSPHDRMKDLRHRMARAERDRQHQNYRAKLDDSTDLLGGVGMVLDEIAEEVQAALDLMQQSGDVKPLKQLVRTRGSHLNRLLSALDNIDLDAEAAAEMIDSAPEEFARQRGERFPSVGEPVAHITEAFLRGEETRDPLGGAR